MFFIGKPSANHCALCGTGGRSMIIPAERGDLEFQKWVFQSHGLSKMVGRKREHPTYKWMMNRGTPISGNLHMTCTFDCLRAICWINMLKAPTIPGKTCQDQQRARDDGAVWSANVSSVDGESSQVTRVASTIFNLWETNNGITFCMLWIYVVQMIANRGANGWQLETWREMHHAPV